MAIITDIQPQKGNKSRVSVFVDGEFFCGLDKLTVAEFRLKAGDEVDPEYLTKAVAENEATSAFEKAVAYLATRARSMYEMKKYLLDKGYSAEATNSAVDKLTEYGYIDDEEYCKAYIREYETRYGTMALRYRLYAKGIPNDIIERNLRAQDDQTETMIRLCRKYLGRHEFDEQKLTSYLYRKGFKLPDMREAIRRVKEEYDY